MAGRVVRGRPAGGRAARGRAALPACCASPSGFYAQQAAVRAGQVLLVDVVEIAVEIAVEQGDVNKSLLLRVAVAAADNGNTDQAGFITLSLLTGNSNGDFTNVNHRRQHRTTDI